MNVYWQFDSIVYTAVLLHCQYGTHIKDLQTAYQRLMTVGRIKAFALVTAVPKKQCFAVGIKTPLWLNGRKVARHGHSIVSPLMKCAGICG